MRLEPLGLPVLRVKPAPPERKAQLVYKAILVRLALQGHRGLLATLAQKAHKDHRAT